MKKKSNEHKKWLNQLNCLKDLFSGSNLLDSEVVESLNTLQETLDDVDWTESSKTKTEVTAQIPNENKYGFFEVPELLKKSKDGGYALYSDGACRGNPGPGAWGCLAQNQNGDVLFELAAAEANTTNNRMEIKGAIEVLNGIRDILEANGEKFSKPLFFYCDSRYVVDGLEKWIPGWKRRSWKKSDNKPPENLELWQELDEVAASLPGLKSVWVKAHAGHPQNERCDELANQALDQALEMGEI